MSGSLATQVGSIAGRSVKRCFKFPVVFIPPLFFPLFILAVLATGAEAATDIPGFPTDSFITFAVGGIFVQGAVSAATVAGGALEEDIESGLLSRLSLTPMRGSALLTGQLGSVAVLGVMMSLVFLGVGLLSGAEIEAGVAAVPVVMLLTVLMCLTFGAIGMFAALRFGAAQDVFPVALGLLFMSSMAMSRNLIEERWFELIATYNPLSYMIEATRSLFITGWDGEALALGVGISVAILVAAVALCASSLRKRLSGT